MRGTRAKVGLVRILGIESSCDETAAAVVASGDAVLSSVVASQIAMHGKYGGVVPELASREHLRAIVPVVREALLGSATRLRDLSAIAVTVGPGLVGSLLVGLTYAKSLSFATGVPLIGVNHIEGHIHAVILESRRDGAPVQFQFGDHPAERVAMHSQLGRGLALVTLVMREHFEDIALFELPNGIRIGNARTVHLCDQGVQFALQRSNLACWPIRDESLL